MSLPDVQHAAPRTDSDALVSDESHLLLTTKLYVPRPHADTVTRPRLYAQLDHALDVPLTVVVAPAGFGKTTLVVQWLHAKPRASAWLSLDANDNDLAAFLRYLVAALRTLAPEIGSTLLALLNTAHPPRPDILMTLLINDLALLNQQTVLVLDDYHVIQSAQTHEMVRLLVERLPLHVHLILTTREDPPLPLTRLRARRQLVEIRAPHLRFTANEAEAFLREVMELPVSADQVAALEARTEGWIAGLYLAALTLQQHDDIATFVRRFTGSQRVIVDYLVEEVLRLLPSHLRSFLLHTAILNRFCAPLCDAVVLGESAVPHAPVSKVLLDQIERINLFLIPLDNEGRWYRFHHLFADVLRSLLEQGSSTGTIAQLHRRASIWYEQHELIVEAITHALAANDQERAALLIEQRAEALFDRTEDALLMQWINMLPQSLIDRRPKLLLAIAFYNMADNLDLIEPLLQAVEKYLASAEAKNHQPEDGHRQAAQGWLDDIPNVVVTIRSILLRVRGNTAAVIALGSELMSRSKPLHPHLRRWTEWNTALAHWAEGDIDAAISYLRLVLDSPAEQEQRGFVVTSTNLGQIYMEQGRLREAVRHFRHTIALAEQQQWSRIPMFGVIYVMLSDALREQNELDEALLAIRLGIEIGQGFGSGQLLAHAYSVLAHIYHAQGNYESAARAFAKVQELIPSLHAQTVMHLPTNVHVVRFYLMHNQISAAVAWAHQHHSHATITDHIADIRIMLARQEYDQAVEQIEQLIAQKEQSGQHRAGIEELVLHSLALARQGKTTRALESLEHALMLAEPEGYVRTFVDEGAPIAALLRQLHARGGQRAYCEALLALCAAEQHPQHVPTPPLAPPAQALAVALTEPLNERELEVLRLIAQGYSNRQIADRLMVAVSTVKWHINNLYGKLGVSTRTQALVRAAELGLSYISSSAESGA